MRPWTQNSLCVSRPVLRELVDTLGWDVLRPMRLTVTTTTDFNTFDENGRFRVYYEVTDLRTNRVTVVDTVAALVGVVAMHAMDKEL